MIQHLRDALVVNHAPDGAGHRTAHAQREHIRASEDGVDLDVAEGEFFTMLGPSGSGKTTLLRMIAGFIAPDSGDIAIGGNSMRGVAPNRRPVNMVFQQLALFPMMSVGENVAFGLARRGVGRASPNPAGQRREPAVGRRTEMRNDAGHRAEMRGVEPLRVAARGKARQRDATDDRAFLRTAGRRR